MDSASLVHLTIRPFSLAEILRQGLNADEGGSTHGQLSGGRTGKINDSATPMRPAIIDRYLDRPAVTQIGHPSSASEWQARVGGGEPVRVEGLAAGGPSAIKSWSVPGRLAHLPAVDHAGGGDRPFTTGTRIGRQAGG